MNHHDVSQEARDDHGRWSKTAGIPELAAPGRRLPGVLTERLKQVYTPKSVTIIQKYLRDPDSTVKGALRLLNIKKATPEKNEKFKQRYGLTFDEIMHKIVTMVQNDVFSEKEQQAVARRLTEAKHKKAPLPRELPATDMPWQKAPFSGLGPKNAQAREEAKTLLVNAMLAGIDPEGKRSREETDKYGYNPLMDPLQAAAKDLSFTITLERRVPTRAEIRHALESRDFYPDSDAAVAGMRAAMVKAFPSWEKANPQPAEVTQNEEQRAAALPLWEEATRKGYQETIDAAKSEFATWQKARPGTNELDWLAAISITPKDAASLVSVDYGTEAQLGKDVIRGRIRDALSSLPLAPQVLTVLADIKADLRVGAGKGKGKDRAYYRGGEIVIAADDKPSVVAHEWGHHLEHILNVEPLSRRWVVDKATKAPAPLGPGYSKDEYAYVDTYLIPYVGKTGEPNTKGFVDNSHTEVTSTGIEAFHTNALSFLALHPDHFWLVVGYMRGYGTQVSVEKDGSIKIARPFATLTKSHDVSREPRNDKGEWVALKAARSRNLRAWFGRSVVTQNGKPGGKPLVVYHGSAADFSVFTNQHAVSSYGTGFYFTDGADLASGFASDFTEEEVREGANVKPVYLRLLNPLRLPADPQKWPKRYQNLWGNDSYKFQERAKEDGYDGVIVRGAGDDGSTYYVVYDPRNIKSASGNQGTFSESDDIGKSHDVSGEPRDETGKWTKIGTGAAIVSIPPLPTPTSDMETWQIKGVAQSERDADQLRRGTIVTPRAKWKKIGGRGKSKPFHVVMECDGEKFEVLIKPESFQRKSLTRKGIPPMTELERGEATCLVNRAMGRLAEMPEEVVRDIEGERSSVQKFVSSGRTIMEAGRAYEMTMRHLHPLPSEDALNIAVLDAAIGNVDRHAGNALITHSKGEDFLVAIDHGLTFPEPVSGYAKDRTINTQLMNYLALRQENYLDFTQERDLRLLQKNRSWVNEQMKRLAIPDKAVDEMWRRVTWMLENAMVPTAGDMETRPWSDISPTGDDDDA